MNRAKWVGKILLLCVCGSVCLNHLYQLNYLQLKWLRFDTSGAFYDLDDWSKRLRMVGNPYGVYDAIRQADTAAERFLTFGRNDLSLLTGKPIVRHTDPRMQAVYMAADTTQAVQEMRKLGIRHIVVPSSGMPPTLYNSLVEDVIADQFLAQLHLDVGRQRWFVLRDSLVPSTRTTVDGHAWPMPEAWSMSSAVGSPGQEFVDGRQVWRLRARSGEAPVLFSGLGPLSTSPLRKGDLHVPMLGERRYVFSAKVRGTGVLKLSLYLFEPAGFRVIDLWSGMLDKETRHVRAQFYTGPGEDVPYRILAQVVGPSDMEIDAISIHAMWSDAAHFATDCTPLDSERQTVWGLAAADNAEIPNWHPQALGAESMEVQFGKSPPGNKMGHLSIESRSDINYALVLGRGTSNMLPSEAMDYRFRVPGMKAADYHLTMLLSGRGLAKVHLMYGSPGAVQSAYVGDAYLGEAVYPFVWHMPLGFNARDEFRISLILKPLDSDGAELFAGGVTLTAIDAIVVPESPPPVLATYKHFGLDGDPDFAWTTHSGALAPDWPWGVTRTVDQVAAYLVQRDTRDYWLVTGSGKAIEAPGDDWQYPSDVSELEVSVELAGQGIVEMYVFSFDAAGAYSATHVAKLLPDYKPNFASRRVRIPENGKTFRIAFLLRGGEKSGKHLTVRFLKIQYPIQPANSGR